MLSKEKSEERRRAWLAAQTFEVAVARVERAKLEAASYGYAADATTAEDELAPMFVGGNLASRFDEHIARAAQVGGHELPIDPGTLGMWISTLPVNRVGQTLMSMRLVDLSPATVYGHLKTLDLGIADELVSAIARRVALVVMNKRNSAEGHGGEYLKGPSWLHVDGPKKARRPAKQDEPAEAKQPPMPPPPRAPGHSEKVGPVLYTTFDVPEGPAHEMCFACGAEEGPSLKRRVTAQVFGQVDDYGKLFVDFVEKATQLAAGAPKRDACLKCGAQVGMVHDAEDGGDGRRAHVREARDVIGRVRIVEPLEFYFGATTRTLAVGTECERLRLSGKEMFPAHGGDEQVGIRWEGRLRYVPLRAVEVIEQPA